jgi:Trypsin-co-occurring domain 2
VDPYVGRPPKRRHLPTATRARVAARRHAGTRERSTEEVLEMAEEWVGLADAIKELRRELQLAMDQGAGAPILFELGPVEMEFLLEIRKEGGGEAGVRFWVVSLSGKGGVSSGSTHRVKLSLVPVGPEGVPTRISDVERDAPAPDEAAGAQRRSASDVEP